MRNFIEIYNVREKTKHLIAVNKIASVVADDNKNTFIELGFDCNGVAYGYTTNESYDSVCQKIYYAQGGR